MYQNLSLIADLFYPPWLSSTPLWQPRYLYRSLGGLCFQSHDINLYFLFSGGEVALSLSWRIPIL